MGGDEQSSVLRAALGWLVLGVLHSPWREFPATASEELLPVSVASLVWGRLSLRLFGEASQVQSRLRSLLPSSCRQETLGSV